MPGEIQAVSAANKPLTQSDPKQVAENPPKRKPIMDIYGEFQEGDTSPEQCRSNNPVLAKKTFNTIDESIKKDGRLDGLEICKYRDIQIDDAYWTNELTYRLTFGWLRKDAKEKYLEQKEHLLQLKKETTEYRKSVGQK